MSSTAEAPAFSLTRQPLEVRRRRVRVARIERITPAYRRVEFAGDDLAGFDSPGADDHVRIFFPPPGEPLPPAPDDGLPAGLASREYTPVEWDGAGRLTVDFVLHGEGVATDWAASAGVGDEVFLGGPRGSLVMTGSPAWWLLAGDLSALPAIRRHLRAVPPGTPVDVVLLSDDPADEQEASSPGDLGLAWVHPAAGAPVGDVTPLLEALAGLPRRDGDGFAFVAAEQTLVAPARELLAARGIDLQRAVVKGYWKRGEAEYHAPRPTA
ncbi:MAG: siderophore-interacting protein [Propionicimonas sp.]|nr:siderophore-interacting protein [Propionicimonas sp.]